MLYSRLVRFGWRIAPLLCVLSVACSLRAQCADWAPVTGTDGQVDALLVLPDGDVVAGGIFADAGGVPASKIARWDGATWFPIGGGLSGGAGVRALAVRPNGDIVAAGQFTDAGGVAAQNIARWDGVAWSPLGAGINGSVLALTVLPNGDLVAGGVFTTAGGSPAENIARWDGTNWHALGSGTTDRVRAVMALPNGDVVVGGQFLTAGGVSARRIARWDGTTWNPLGTGISGLFTFVSALTRLPNGDLVACGVGWSRAGSVPAVNVARWDGSNWFALGEGIPGFVSGPRAVVCLPGGDVIVGGDFNTAGGVPAENIARWDGASWAPLGVGTNSQVVALVVRPGGDMIVGGAFATAGTYVASNFARYASTCPATTTSYGTGCAGGGGSLVLEGLQLAWVGGTYRARVSGLSTGAAAVDLLGFNAASIPLSSLLSVGGAGCDLLVDIVSTQALTPSGGHAYVEQRIPNDLSLVGAVLFDQALQLEFSSTSALSSVRSTNGLRLTLGAF